MKLIQDAKLDMYNVVISYCNQNAAIIASLPALQIAFTSFKDIVSSITATAQQRALAISGITENKNKLRQALAQHTADIAFKIYAYATSVTNYELKAQVNFSLPGLLKLKDEELCSVCMNIAAVATSNLTVLLTYSITADTLKDFTARVEEYKNEIPRGRNAVSNRTANIKSLNDLFKTADNILKSQLDKIIATFKSSNATFYTPYLSNRMIMDPHSTATQIKGTVTNVNNEPVTGAKVEVTGSDATAITNADGKYVIKPLAPGTWSLKVTKEGFQQKIITDLPVKSGQVTTVDVGLTTGVE